MKQLLVFLMLLTGSSLISQIQPQPVKRVQTAVIKTMIYCDHCKECESCGGRLLKELYNENGIKNTEVNPKANTITVVYDSKKIQVETIRKRISMLGFDADEVKADPGAVAKLDDCCQKP